ncbi:hypothetical protein [Frankia sp. EAN1pec]|uniref:hypothetical protein n=1 Tax=Parafrankia sp. (strain EAN1pec) TaxID=298653 RepID=UPI0000543326
MGRQRGRGGVPRQQWRYVIHWTYDSKQTAFMADDDAANVVALYLWWDEFEPV